jgi:hypothetical protein
MPCERFENALSDTAAGAAATVELEAHLASCERCRDRLLGLRQALLAADEELSRIAAAMPSPALRARIRAAVAARQERTGARWLWASVGTAAVVVLAALWITGTPEQHGPVVGGTIATRDDSTGRRAGAAPQPSAPGGREARATPEPGAIARPATSDETRGTPPGGTPHGDSPTRVASVPAATTTAGRDRAPEVIVPRGEMEALRRLVVLVHRERLEPAVLGAVARPAQDLPELTPIDIEPLRILPLDAEESSGRAESSGPEKQGDTP